MIVYILISVAVLVVPSPPWLSLIAGVALALTYGNPNPQKVKKVSSLLLGWAIVGLGAGINLSVVAKAGADGLVMTIVTISATMIVGYFLGRWLKVPEDTSLLISTGTAICGGSAIAAMAPVTQAKPENVSVSLATVFLLNALALFLFPILGHGLNLSQQDFGLWSALAIHDTSSVVGAASQFGDEALKLATTIKLARALWIAPLVLAVQIWRSRKTQGKITWAWPPWFIFGFIVASALVTWVPVLTPAASLAGQISKRLLSLALFLIGTGLTRKALANTGFRPVAQGFILWVLVTASTLGFILVQRS